MVCHPPLFHKVANEDIIWKRESVGSKDVSINTSPIIGAIRQFIFSFHSFNLIPNQKSTFEIEKKNSAILKRKIASSVLDGDIFVVPFFETIFKND